MAQYFANKSKWRIRETMATPKGGPLAPPTRYNGPPSIPESARSGPTGPRSRPGRPSPGVISLDPSQYSRISPASQEMQSYARYQRNIKQMMKFRQLRNLLGISPQGIAFNLAVDAVETGLWGITDQADPSPASPNLPSGWSSSMCCDIGGPYTDTTMVATGSVNDPCGASGFSLCGLSNQAASVSPIGTDLQFGRGQSYALRYWERQASPPNRFTLRKTEHIIKPFGDAAPVPWNPARPGVVTVSPIPEYSTPPRPSYSETTHRNPDDYVAPKTPPYGDPSLDIEFVPRGPIRIKTGTHYQLPPPRRQYNERKSRTNMGAAYRLLNRIIGGTGEMIEFVEAFHDALPERYQCGGCTPQRKLEIVFQHANKLDGDKVVWNLLTNHGEDWFFGRVGQESANAGQNNGWVFGPQTGPWDTIKMPSIR